MWRPTFVYWTKQWENVDGWLLKLSFKKNMDVHRKTKRSVVACQDYCGRRSVPFPSWYVHEGPSSDMLHVLYIVDSIDSQSQSQCYCTVSRIGNLITVLEKCQRAGTIKVISTNTSSSLPWWMRSMSFSPHPSISCTHASKNNVALLDPTTSAHPVLLPLLVWSS